MAALQPVRGTHDLLPDDFRAQHHVSETAARVADRYGYDRVSTPIFEFTNVFSRTLGDTSDVVTKEMYTFTDKGGEQITLRPENTAGVCRSFLSNGLSQNTPIRFFYAGPMFRYERPQKGRLRQFHQIGIELIGAPQPAADVEVIACGAAILDQLGIRADTKLELNSLGDTESRAAYRSALVEYFSSHADDLSEESKERLGRNPLRILDSKDSGDRVIVEQAPVFGDYLTAESTDFFQAVCDGLDTLSIAYSLNPRLVRGLDYYCHTAFEFTTDKLGAQSAVMAGGRYDGLMEMMGGPATPGIGWAAGIERLALLTGVPERSDSPIALVPMGSAAESACTALVDRLRRQGLRVDMAFSGNMKKRMRRADKIGASHAVILGDQELERGVAAVKTLATGDQADIVIESVGDYLKSAQ